MLRELCLDGRRCFLYRQENARTALIQAVDGRGAEPVAREIALLRARTDQPFSLAAFAVDDWNEALSPWPAPPVFGDAAFGGGAERTLRFVADTLLPRLRKAWAPERFCLGGYSLSGLFALWAACRTDDFDGAAACSPSVWFPGWMEYAEKHPIRAGRVYLSLGDREEKTKNRAMARVGDCARGQYELLKRQGVACVLEWNPGNHFAEPDLRMARGFAWLLNGGNA